jgi:hypothetical protein
VRAQQRKKPKSSTSKSTARQSAEREGGSDERGWHVPLARNKDSDATAVRRKTRPKDAVTVVDEWEQRRCASKQRRAQKSLDFGVSAVDSAAAPRPKPPDRHHPYRRDKRKGKKP